MRRQPPSGVRAPPNQPSVHAQHPVAAGGAPGITRLMVGTANAWGHGSTEPPAAGHSLRRGSYVRLHREAAARCWAAS
jgi:hypothetical protein